jgi:hypothetical protein
MLNNPAMNSGQNVVASIWYHTKVLKKLDKLRYADIISPLDSLVSKSWLAQYSLSDFTKK